MTIELTLSILGFSGLLIALYVREKKRAKKVLVCPLRAHCDPVIHSDYSKFMRIPVEVLGIFYYSVAAFGYNFLGLFAGPISLHVSSWLLGLSAVSVIFSVYLLSIQAFALKHWCSWCIASAVISVSIFFISAFKFHPNLL